MKDRGKQFTEENRGAAVPAMNYIAWNAYSKDFTGPTGEGGNPNN